MMSIAWHWHNGFSYQDDQMNAFLQVSQLNNYKCKIFWYWGNAQSYANNDKTAYNDEI